MNGVLIVNKPKDYTSRDIVNIISKKFNTKKVGHTGTLDPLAEGVLIVPIGKALKVAELLTSETKEYSRSHTRLWNRYVRYNRNRNKKKYSQSN